MEFSAQFEKQHSTTLVINYICASHASVTSVAQHQSKQASDIMIIAVLLNSIVLSSFFSHQHRKIILFKDFKDTFRNLFPWHDSYCLSKELSRI